jgi:A/G-specific adenine glycosylase
MNHLRRTAVCLGRHEATAFPWRRRPSAYRTLIAEMLLQHTPASRVASVYPSFLERWPTLAALRTAHVRELQRVLRPLGLQRRRARVLIRMAQTKRIHRQVGRLLALHGIGSYTAGVTSTVLTGRAVPFADGGIARLICRYFGLKTQRSRAAEDPQVHALVRSVIQGANARFATWGIVDLARTVCRPKPLCATCPARSSCAFVGRS